MEVDSPLMCSQVSARTVRFSGMLQYIAGWMSLGILKEILLSSRVPGDTVSLPSRPKSLIVPPWKFQISKNIKLCAKFYDKLVSSTMRYFSVPAPNCNHGVSLLVNFLRLDFQNIRVYMMTVFSVCSVDTSHRGLFIVYGFRDIISNSENVLTVRIFHE
jgi:hypothetical protein